MLPIKKSRLLYLVDQYQVYGQDVDSLLRILKSEIATLLIEEQILINNKETLRNAYNFNNRKIKSLETMIAAMSGTDSCDDTYLPLISRLNDLKANSPIIEKNIEDEERKIIAVSNERALYQEKEKTLSKKVCSTFKNLLT